MKDKPIYYELHGHHLTHHLSSRLDFSRLVPCIQISFACLKIDPQEHHQTLNDVIKC